MTYTKSNRAKRKPAKRKPANPILLPVMLGESAVASVQTISKRLQMMTSGTCSASEYQRMLTEKMAAAAESAAVLSRCQGIGDATELLAPWHRRVKANAKRLRKKRT